MNDICERCKTDVDGELHSCPYNEDINGDDSEVCNCCSICMNECAADI